MNVLENSGADVDTLFDVQVPVPPVVDVGISQVRTFEFEVEFDDVWLDYFRTPPFFVRSQIFIAGENGDTLSVYGGDYISVQAIANILYTVRPGGVE